MMCATARTFGAGFFALAFFAGGTTLRAAAPEPYDTLTGRIDRPRVDRPWYVRAELIAAGKGGFFSDWNSASSVAVTVGRSLVERVAVELTYGEDRPLAGMDPSWGRTGMANARWAFMLSPSRRHALTLAGGPFVLAGGFNGTVPFAHSELAYEYRGAFGISILAGFGTNVALANGKPQQGDVQDCLLGCLVSYKTGDVLPTLRLGFGYSF